LINTFESSKNWLLKSGIHINTTNDPNFGAVQSFFDIKQNNFGFLYPEITGYFLSTNRFLYHIENNENYIKNVKISSEWIINLYERYGGIIQGIYKNGKNQKLVYSFDTAVCVTGLIDSFLLTKDIRYLNYSQKMIGELIEEAIDEDGTVLAFKNIEDNLYVQSSEIWYKKTGCFHIKIALPLFKLYKITKKNEFLELATKICNSYKYFQKEDGSLTMHKKGNEINLHTLCYALEGLLFAFSVTSNHEYLECCKKNINWCLKKIGNDGDIELWHNSKHRSIAAYPLAQLIRIIILIDKIENKNQLKDKFLKSYKYLLNFQANETNYKINGGFFEEYYKTFFGWKKRLRINSWTTMFAIQAIYWFENSNNIKFENEIDFLY
jgi:uncharacterized protein YyaL (SSP411 family)